MAQRLTEKQKVNIINAYTLELVPMAELAREYNIDRSTVYKVIKRAGVDIKSQGKLKVSCTACGKLIERARCRVRKQKHHFCSNACYDAYLSAGARFSHVVGDRIARARIREHFDIQPKHVIHRLDGNYCNNDLDNLLVFKSFGDRVRYIRLGDDYVKPLWSGKEFCDSRGFNDIRGGF